MNQFYLTLWYLSFVVIINGTLARETIVGGKIAKDGRFPYHVVMLVHDRDFECGGGIIGDEFILTAAHCVVNDDKRFVDGPITILAGTHDRQAVIPPPVIAHAKKIFVPKTFKPKSKYPLDDIAVIKLKKGLGLSVNKHLMVLQLPKNKNENYAGKTAVITGYGWDWVEIQAGKEIGGQSDTRLRFAEAVILSPGQPGYPVDEVDDKRIWARIVQRPNQHRGVCSGDSGGSLVYDEKIVIGILSGGPPNCSERDTGSVYTEVTKYLNFIQHALHDKYHDNIRTHEM